MRGIHVTVSRDWTNWASTATAKPATIAAPTDVDGIVADVRTAAERGQRLKVPGSGHSFTGIAAPESGLLDLSGFRVPPVIDTTTKRVTVGSSTTLRELNAVLDAHGLALANLGDIDAQTVAGATSTGTHGTGGALGGLATFIRGLTLVDGEGVVHEIGEDDPRLKAVALGLGALGVITTVTLQCVDAFALVADERPMPLDQAVAEFDALADQNDHVEFFWFPRAEQVLLKRNNRSGEAAPLSSFRRWLDDDFLSNSVFGAACRLGRAVPAMVPAVTAVSAKALSQRTYRDVSHRVFCTPRRVRFVEMEYAVPREAFAEVFAALRAEASARRIVFPVEVRVAAADDLWLSTAHGRDSVYFAVHQFQGMPYREYFDAIEAIMRAADGRPHWGKMHWRSAEDLATTYPRFVDFTALRDELDPARVFSNSYLDRVLGV